MSKPEYGALSVIFLGILIIIGGMITLIFLASGIALAGFSWLVFLSPDFLETYRITFLGERINNPFHAFLLFLVTGLTLIAVGIILFGFLYYTVKFIQ